MIYKNVWTQYGRIIDMYGTLNLRMRVKIRKNMHVKNKLPPVRIELTTPGLQDLCSATELKRLPADGALQLHLEHTCITFLPADVDNVCCSV